MKSLVLTVAMLTSLATFACVDISGKYLCPTPGSSRFSEMQLKKNAEGNIFSTIGEDYEYRFEVGSLNPVINIMTGEVEEGMLGFAECKGDSVILKYIATVGNPDDEDDIFVSLTGALNITPTKDGVKIVESLDDIELDSRDCKRQE